MIRLVVFDLDGTLVDSSRDLADAVNALLTEFTAPALSRELVTSMVGDGAAVLVKRALTAAGVDPDTPHALERFLELYDARLLDSTRPYPEMLDTLNRLYPRHRLAVLTNKPGRPTAEILKGLEIDRLFSDVIGGDSGHGRKPNPAGLLDLVRRASVTRWETLLVGDSPVDLETSRRAGTRICLARYGFGYRFEGNGFRGDEYFIDGPAELPAIISTIG